LIKFGIASALVYKPYLNMLDDKKHTFDRMNTVFTEVPKKEVVYTPSGYAPLQTDLKHKGRVWNGDYKSDELHFIKHAHVAYFLAPTALATLALAWQASTQVLSTAREIWHFVAIVAAIVYFALLALYLAKLVLYPHRVLKEWSNPVSGNAMFLIPVTWMMLSYLEYVDDVDASRVLFWIGAVIQMAMTILKAADWFYFPSSAGNINSSWLILPAACFVGTIAGNFSNAPGYDEPLLFWFGVGIVLSIGIYAVIIYSVILDHYSDRRQRPFLAFHGALPALILLAYLSTGSAFDLFAKSLFYYTCFAHIIMLAGSIRGFFMIHRFDVSYWAFGVSFSAFALASLYYHQALGTKWSEVLVYITLSAACTSVFVR
jgi:tellurite resistance protein